MGNDGGSIPTRSELVRVKKKAPIVDPSEQERTKWLTCSLSKEPLGKSVYADFLGNMYDKFSLLKAITERSLPEKLSHIRGLKDIFQIYFTENVDYDANREHDMGDESKLSPFECPITHIPVAGTHRFSALTTCGHIFSAKGLSVTNAASSESPCCYVCQKPYTVGDIIPLNPNEEDLSVLQEKLKERKKSAHRERKEKRKKGGDASKSKPKRQRVAPPPTVASETKATPQSLAVKLAMEEVNQKHNKKKESSDAYRSIFGTTGNDSNSGVYTTGIFRM